MAFDLKIYSLGADQFNPLGVRKIVAEYSDVLSLAPEHILQTIISRIADKFIEDHYAEIEKELDPKLVAAVTAAKMGEQVEKKMLQEVSRVQEVANQALRRAKRNR